MSASCSCSSPPLLIPRVSITLLSISIAFLSHSIISFQKRSNAEFAGGSSDTSKKDDHSCNPSKEDEKHQSGSSRKPSTPVGPPEGDEEPKDTTPGSSVSRKGDASSNSLPSEKEDEGSPTISNSDRDGGPGRTPKHDGGQEDAPSGNRISVRSIALSNCINDEGSHARTPPISNTAGDAPKSIRQHEITASGGRVSENISLPVNKFTRGGRGTTWACGHCNSGSMDIFLDIHCIYCGRRRDAYSSSPVTFPRARR